MYHHFDVNGLSDGRVVFKLELEPEHPRQPSLLMRSPGGQQEQPLEFLGQSNGRDYFTVVLSAPQPFEYALRVTTPAQCWWLTPKGEEHDDGLPHNWFHWPLSPAPEALEEVGATGGRKGTEVGAARLLQEAHRRAQGQPRAPPEYVPPAGGGPSPADLRLRAPNPRQPPRRRTESKRSGPGAPGGPRPARHGAAEQSANPGRPRHRTCPPGHHRAP